MKHDSIVAKFNKVLAQYRPQLLVVLAVAAGLLLLASQIFPQVQSFLLQTNVVSIVTLLIVIDLASMQLSEAKTSGQALAANQDESMPLLVERVAECRNGSADLLEYAGATTLPLIRKIAREGIAIRILIKHPETTQGLQKDRMITTLDTLYNSVFDGATGGFEVRCYRQPYSLRGRKLGEALLEVGWLTPDYRRHTAYGHGNPSFLVELTNPASKPLLELFTRTFADLWDAPDTEDGMLVLVRLSRAP
jgi:hypothetical protein